MRQNFTSKEHWDELWDYFELILGSWRDIGEVVGSLMLENRSQNKGNLAAHLRFESKSESASLLKAPQSLPKGVLNRIKVVKRNNRQRIDKLYTFEGYQNDDFFKQVSKINLSIVSRYRMRKNIQKPKVFLMILRVRSIGRLKKKL